MSAAEMLSGSGSALRGLSVGRCCCKSFLVPCSAALRPASILPGSCRADPLSITATTSESSKIQHSRPSSSGRVSASSEKISLRKSWLGGSWHTQLSPGGSQWPFRGESSSEAWNPQLSVGRAKLPTLAASLSPQENAAPTKTTASLIDGKAIAAMIREEIRKEVEQMRSSPGGGVTPGLAVVLVGARKDSQTYVRMKKKACEEAGVASFGVDLPASATQEEVEAVVKKLNEDERVHGVLVQLPLPDHINEEAVLSAVSLDKDVDGFHPINIGHLAMTGRQPLFVPCTPKGCIELLLRSGVQIAGKRAVVVGRSNIVGMPAALLLQGRNATVTVVHSRTRDPHLIAREADIIVAAAGVPNLVTREWMKPGCVIIDVGINAVDDSSSPRGYRLVGDVSFEDALSVASAVTPVPGGVGPMTIAMLLRNTVDAAKRTMKGTA